MINGVVILGIVAIALVGMNQQFDEEKHFLLSREIVSKG